MTTTDEKAPPAGGLPPARARRSSRLRAVLRSPYFPIWPATLVLFLVSPLVASGSVTPAALKSMLPFASVLAIVAVGQTLVIQQRGLDLAVPGVVSLSAIVVTKLTDGGAHPLVVAVIASLLVGAIAGGASGLAITQLGITPLVATLGVNALLLGTILTLTGGSSTASATDTLAGFALGDVAGVPNLVIVAVVLVVVVSWVIRRTTVGRRFVAIGTSATAARAAGFHVRRYVATTYVVAGLCYSFAGVLLAGYLRTPGLSPGDSYLLPSIAAVVLGGTSLAGGSGSVVASAAGALFLTQLQQVVFGAGAPTSVQLLIQGAAIGIGMGIRTIPWGRWRRALSRRPPVPV
jgi:ribose transport system permease protein